MSSFATMLSYHCVTDEEILYRCFGREKRYEWSDVTEVSNRTTERGAQVSVLEMKDGHVVILDGMSVEQDAESIRMNNVN